jgi:ABC-type uncharacterized transport system involved in gliding motility auxiliary subunit
MKRRAFLGFALASTLVLFVSVNAAASVLLRGARLDLTEDQLYSLSPGSGAVVQDLAEPVDLTLYFSRGLAQDFPVLRAYGARVRETLQAFADRSHGKLRLAIVDPEPFSEEEDAAFAAGLRAAPTGDGESVYFGLVARNALDETRIVPFFSPEREPYLEYEVTRAIAELADEGETKVALITSLPLESAEPGALGGVSSPRPIHFYDQLLANFAVETLDEDFATIPDDADVLMIAHPGPLDPGQLWAIDQWVLRRGRAVVLVDPYSRLALQPGPTGFPDMDAEASSDLGGLLEAWGVGYDPTRVVIDRRYALIAGMEEGGRRVERPYPLWLEAPPEALSARDLSTAALTRGITFAAAGALEPLETPGIAFEPLISTSTEARMIDRDDAVDATPDALTQGYVPEGRFTLGARLSGVLPTAFPDGAPEEVLDPAEPILSGEAEVVVLADADVLDDAFYVTRDPLFGDTTQADNAAFLLNVIDILSGADALVGLRSRARSDRPLTVIEEMGARADEALAAEQTDLEAQLEDAEQRLRELESGGPAAGEGLEGEERLEAQRNADAEYDRMRDAVVDARARLREIEREHRSSIDRLQAIVIALNVWLPALLVAAAGVGVFVLRRRSAGGAS